ncbi:TIGR02301 family protein [Oricola cellulosilytica]|uniref:TIGR02301 family protein n=1 Tax=Oricola cellulosilytica TaxID=1429082 RepID=A0A4V2MNS1_9HYPH|nr:TIGR02301 family protein [Oricola cellulosilytica]TCD14267.1 TIGR02301 family protein [Oricola cellulosilytica]
MRFGKLPYCLLIVALAFGAPHAARAQAGPSAVVPYDENLLRLAEVLGSVHYLRNVCGEESNSWRERMEELLVVENPEPLRRARLVASFNRGYRTFDSVYTKCTRQALDAVERYMREGLELTREINSRYGE